MASTWKFCIIPLRNPLKQTNCWLYSKYLPPTKTPQCVLWGTTLQARADQVCGIRQRDSSWIQLWLETDENQNEMIKSCKKSKEKGAIKKMQNSWQHPNQPWHTQVALFCCVQGPHVQFWRISLGVVFHPSLHQGTGGGGYVPVSNLMV